MAPAHRSALFRELLMIPRRAHEQIWVGYDDACAELVPSEPYGPVQRWLVDHALWLGRSWLFHVYLYALAVIGFVVLAVRQRNRELVALGTSALVSELAYFFFAPATDFRYSVWLVPVAIIMAVHLFVQRYRRAEPDEPVDRISGGA